MQRDSSSPQSQPPDGPHRNRQSPMDFHLPLADADLTAASSPWDWGDLLDFTTDDAFQLSVDAGEFALHSPMPSVEDEPDDPLVDRVRKRDPRMSCSNFLAGHVPCACPEVDEKFEAEEAAKIGAPSKKRARTVRVLTRKGRCQVPECGADISELKGYHRRHRVCLRCANATTVFLDGQTKRYCQQCGKFHVLSDFDEGKRSCRRKLERHNNRRRRKATVSSNAVTTNEGSGHLHLEEVDQDHECGKDDLSLSSQLADQEAPFESEDGHLSTLGSVPLSQNVASNNTVSGDADCDGGNDDSNFPVSPTNHYSKTAYSSMCPTGRISFKLYDWNPAEFPRRLRHQIFQWLANMPVELEGYIRPGCTILTVFISMPKDMWMKVSEHPLRYLHDFVYTPGRILYGRGFMTVYLNHMIFRTMKDGSSLKRINMEFRVPKLHFVHPSSFEAGKPMEFVACGSNLIQSNFRFLVSFAGKYLAYDLCAVSTRLGTKKNDPDNEHQLYKLRVPLTEPEIFGPAFIEVENESGLSNFIPVLIGDTEICSEMKSIQQKFNELICLDKSNIRSNWCLSEKCETSALTQMALSDLVLDVAWILKEPMMESIEGILIPSQIQRINCLLSFLIQNESTIILKKLFPYLKTMIEKMGLNSPVSGTNDLDIQLFQKCMDDATNILYKKHHGSASSSLLSECIIPERECCEVSPECDSMSLALPLYQGIQNKPGREIGGLITSTADDTSVTVPLLDREVVMDVNLSKDRSRRTCSPLISFTVTRSRPTVLVVVTAALCFGICAAYLHPQKLGDFAVTIHRCLFNRT